MTPWHPPEHPPDAFPEIQEALHILSKTGRLVIACRAPLYAQQLAQALLNHQKEQYAYIAFWDSRNDDDALLCLAAALGCPLSSTLVDIATHLNKNEVTALICVGMSNRCLSLIDTLSSLNPSLTFVLIGDPHLQTTIHHSLHIEAFEDPEQYISEHELLRTAEGILAYLPAGLDLPHNLDERVAFPTPQGWLQIHPNLASYLRERLDPRPLLDILSRHLMPLLSTANGAPLPSNTRPQHFFALRWLAETTLDDALSLKATLAQAKVLLAWAHYEQAQSLLEAAIVRSPDMPGRAIGLITATIAECFHYRGQSRAAQQYFTRAASYAEKDKDHKAQIFILRQQAESLRILHRGDEAEVLLKDALQKATHFNLESERRAILYGLSGLSVTQVDIDYASNLLEQSLVGHPNGIEIYNQRIREAEIACAQGNVEGAHRKLVEAEQIEGLQPQLMANLLHRRSHLYLIDSHFEQALKIAEQAAPYFQASGGVVGLASLFRDMATCQMSLKRPYQALQYFRKSMVLYLQLQDLRGLEQCLELTVQLFMDKHPEQESFLNDIIQEVKPLLTS